MADGQLEAALNRFRGALELQPGNPALEYNIGLALFRMERFDEALAPLQRATAHPPSAPQAHLMCGIVLYERGDLTAAAPELEAARAHPDAGEMALYMLVETYRHGDDPERAQAAFLELERRYPGSAFYHKLMGSAFDSEGMHAEALAEFQAALRKNPRMPEIPFAIGFIHFKKREHEQARKWLESEIALQPCHAKAHHYLGEIEMEQDNTRGAEDRYRQAINCDGSIGEAHAGLGGLLLREGRFEEAHDLLQRAVELDPQSAEAHYALGRALMRLGHRDDANAAFRRVDEIHAQKHETAQRAIGNSDQSP